MPSASGHKAAPPGGTIEAVYSGDVEGTSWQVVHYFASDGSADSDIEDFDLVLEDLYALFAAKIIAPFCHEATHFTEVWGHLFSDDGERIRHRKAGTAVGNVVGELAPAQVSTLIDWNARTPGRGGNPSSYIPGVPMAHLQDNHLFEASVLVDLNAAAADYVRSVNLLSAGPITFVLFGAMSFVAGKAYREHPLLYPILGGRVRPVASTQRRRIDRAA